MNIMRLKAGAGAQFVVILYWQHMKAGLESHAYNPSTLEEETGRSEVSLSYIVSSRPS